MNETAGPGAGPLIIYGAGGHGQVVADAAAEGGWRVLGFVDDDPPGNSRGGHSGAGDWPHLDKSALQDRRNLIIVAIGDNAQRHRIAAHLADAGCNLANVIHPSASVSTRAALGRGVFIGPRAVVNAGATIGDGCIINSGAIVEHHCRIGNFAHIAPGAVLGGAAQIGALTLVGLSATVLPVVRIGAHCIIGAGAAVIDDVGDDHTMVGVPARPL
jgi:sugar O-acyltransferase (sialic acid O-acetyltransferase NeuD family)